MDAHFYVSNYFFKMSKLSNYHQHLLPPSKGWVQYIFLNKEINTFKDPLN